MVIAADLQVGAFNLYGLEWAIGCAIAELVALGLGVVAFVALLVRRRRVRPGEPTLPAAAGVLGAVLPGTLLAFGLAWALGAATFDVYPDEWLPTLDALWPAPFLPVALLVLLPPWLVGRRLTH